MKNKVYNIMFNNSVIVDGFKSLWAAIDEAAFLRKQHVAAGGSPYDIFIRPALQ